jgi:hypothetical protein
MLVVRSLLLALNVHGASGAKLRIHSQDYDAHQSRSLLTSESLSSTHQLTCLETPLYKSTNFAKMRAEIIKEYPLA